MLGVKTYLQQFIDAHPKSVHQLLLGYGILKPPSPEVLINMFVAFGNPFLSELVNIAYDGETSNYVTSLSFYDSEPQNFETATQQAQEKKSVWNTLESILNNGVQILDEIGQIITPNDGSYDFKAAEAAKKAEADKKAKTLLWAGIAVIFIIIIAIFITKK